jgi:hypothetical protein
MSTGADHDGRADTISLSDEDAVTPLILVGRMWPGLVEWARASMLSADPPLAGPDDMSIPRCVASGDEAIALLREHHARWEASLPAIDRSA